MDKTQELRNAYEELISAMELPHQNQRLFEVYKEVITPNEFAAKLDSELEMLYEKYLGLIEDPFLKHIALSRIEKDFILFEENVENRYYYIEDNQTKRVIAEDNDFSVSSKIWNELCILMNNVYFSFRNELITKDLADLEFKLIGASTKRQSKKKPTIDTQLSLNQLQICGLFKTLQGLKIINQTPNTQLCNPLGQMLDSKPEQVRQNLSKKLEQVDKDKIVAQLLKAIEHVDEKLVNKVSIQK